MSVASPAGRIKRHLFRKLVIIPVIVLFVLVFFGITFFLPYVAAKTPDPVEVPRAQTVLVYDAHGQEFAKLGISGLREIVPSQQVPSCMPDAAIAAEDHHYYANGAVAWKGILRAGIIDLTHGRLSQGGSGIVQQYVKNAYLSPERSYQRKAKEILIATKLAQTTDKDDILLDYLNTIYFGRGANGIQAAANEYFGIDAAQMKVDQCAYLAAIIRAPAYYEAHAVDALARRNLVLHQMAVNALNLPPNTKYWSHDRGFDEVKAEAVLATPVRLRKPTRLTGVLASPYPYAASLVQAQLVDKYGSNVLTSGARVYTTFNPSCQHKLDQAVHNFAGDALEPRVGATVMNPHTGAIPCFYGGSDYQKQSYDASWQAIRQAGSTMKVATLVAAVEKGIAIDDKRPAPDRITVTGSDGKPYTVPNFPGEHFPDGQTIREATWNSVNTVYVPLGIEVGDNTVASVAKQMGVLAKMTSGSPTPDVPEVTSLPLGTNDVSTLGLATMYSTLANRGRRVDPYFIQRIKSAYGNEIYRHEEHSTEVMSQQVADTVNEVLHQNTLYGTASNTRIQVDSAGKTGTTNDRKDLRYVGYTTGRVCSVWIGYSHQQPITSVFGHVATGGGSSGLIWRSFMSVWIGHRPNVPFVLPVAPSPSTIPPATVVTPSSELPATTEVPTVASSQAPSTKVSSPANNDTSVATLTPIGPTETYQ